MFAASFPASLDEEEQQLFGCFYALILLIFYILLDLFWYVDIRKVFAFFASLFWVVQSEPLGFFRGAFSVVQGAFASKGPLCSRNPKSLRQKEDGELHGAYGRVYRVQLARSQGAESAGKWWATVWMPKLWHPRTLLAWERWQSIPTKRLLFLLCFFRMPGISDCRGALLKVSKEDFQQPNLNTNHS